MITPIIFWATIIIFGVSAMMQLQPMQTWKQVDWGLVLPKAMIVSGFAFIFFTVVSFVSWEKGRGELAEQHGIELND